MILLGVNYVSLNSWVSWNDLTKYCIDVFKGLICQRVSRNTCCSYGSWCPVVSLLVIYINGISFLSSTITLIVKLSFLILTKSLYST